MIRGLKQKFSESNLLLTLKIRVPHSFDPKKIDLATLSRFVDFLIIMQTYDRNGNRKGYTIYEAFQDRNITQIKAKIELIIKLGVLPSKLVMYLSASGVAFTINTFHTECRGSLPYQNICHYQKQNCTEKHDNTGLNILDCKNSTSSSTLWIIYENLRTIAHEGLFVVQNDLAGILMSLIQHDDYLGVCGIDAENTFHDFKPITGTELTIPIGKSTTFSLLRAINAAVGVTSQFTGQIEYTSPSPLPPPPPVDPNIPKNLTEFDEPVDGAAFYFVVNKLCLLLVAMLMSLTY